MSRVYSFKATLIGANKQQNVNFCLESAGISISESGDRSQVIANLSFPYIVKISRSPCGQGTPRILDISVHTKAGVQNLKVLVDSAKAVCTLHSTCFSKTVIGWVLRCVFSVYCASTALMCRQISSWTASRSLQQHTRSRSVLLLVANVASL